jgi:hypothetical protein
MAAVCRKKSQLAESFSLPVTQKVMLAAMKKLVDIENMNLSSLAPSSVSPYFEQCQYCDKF